MKNKKAIRPHMKHIRKKPMHYPEGVLDIGSENLLKFYDGIPHESWAVNPPLNYLKYDVLKTFEDGTRIKAFGIMSQKKVLLIPVVNPVLVYFNQAQQYLNVIKEFREKIDEEFPVDYISETENTMATFFSYFGSCSTFVILAFTAWEAFINQKIPYDKMFAETGDKKYSKVYNYEQAQRFMTFENKIKLILEPAYNKNFKKVFQHSNELLVYLKEFRNEIVHTRMENNTNTYQSLFKKALEFKYLDTLYALRDFINYYDPELIETCPCDKEH